MFSYPDIISFVDWDYLQVPIIVNRIDNNSHLPTGEKQLILQRDSDYNLKGLLTFRDPDYLNQYFSRKNDDVIGKIHEGFQIKCTTNDDATITLDSCFISGLSSHENSEYPFSVVLRFNELRIKFSEREPFRLREWYLNGSKSIASLDNTFLHQCSKEQFKSKAAIDYSKSSGAHSFSHHYIWGKLSEFKFLLAKVPVNEPLWSTNIQIEYHKGWGKIPEQTERIKMEEACSFVLGKHLLSLGYSVYDENENLIEISAHNPWGNDAKRICTQPEYGPVRIRDFPSGDAESFLNSILPNYLEQRDCLNLSDALWTYWISLDVPIGMNLAIISSSIETIIDGWFASNKSLSKGLYLKQDLFQELMGDFLLKIEKRLESLEHGGKIFDKIVRSNEFGIMERYRMFFKEIGLEIRPSEWEAIRGRHHFVHGHAQFQKTDWKQVIPQVNTMQTLFNRTMLKVLGYKGAYIDRSIEGWPDVNLG